MGDLSPRAGFINSRNVPDIGRHFNSPPPNAAPHMQPITTVGVAEMQRIAQRSPADDDYRIIAVQNGANANNRAQGTMAIVDRNGLVVSDPSTGRPAIYNFVSGGFGKGAVPGMDGRDYFGSQGDGVTARWGIRFVVYDHDNPRIDGFFACLDTPGTGRSEIGIHKDPKVANGDVRVKGGSLGCPVMNESDTDSFARVFRAAESAGMAPDTFTIASRNLGRANFSY